MQKGPSRLAACEGPLWMLRLVRTADSPQRLSAPLVTSFSTHRPNSEGFQPSTRKSFFALAEDARLLTSVRRSCGIVSVGTSVVAESACIDMSSQSFVDRWLHYRQQQSTDLHSETECRPSQLYDCSARGAPHVADVRRAKKIMSTPQSRQRNGHVTRCDVCRHSCTSTSQAAGLRPRHVKGFQARRAAR